ncbi:hypothetical protein VNI00_013082 [Paramarasmius palmivorus]|uniref:NADH:flavin oxidoreductase/NADH oxidase N-terminal domain-containing protein n=1 Tax=Paramarasmius palmivorus TaxID=297713 RepID=A0AAW0BYQ0_9AGAR
MNTTSIRIGRLGLSQELIDLIVDFLQEDRDALTQCCYTSHSFLSPARRNLFHCIRLNPVSETEGTKARAKLGAETSQTTMCDRLYQLLLSAPHIRSLIKDLRIRNLEDEDSSIGWLQKDNPLPDILPMLSHLQRIYLAGSMSESLLEMSSLAPRVKDALFTVFQSPKVTHIGFQCVQFSSFPELLEAIAHCSAAQNITFFAVDIDNDDLPEDEGPLSTNDTKQIPPMDQFPIDSLALFMEPDLSSRFCTWLLSPPANLALSSLRKFSLVAELTQNLDVIDKVVQASPVLEEMNITIISGHGPTAIEPMDISSLRVIHVGIDVDIEEPEQCEAALNWWCNCLTSSKSLSITDFNIYILVEYDGLPGLQFTSAAWARLDEVLSTANTSVNLNVQIKCLDDEDPLAPDNHTVPTETLQRLEGAFPRMRKYKRLVVGQMKNIVIRAMTTLSAFKPNTAVHEKSLLQSVKIGHVDLSHRVVLAPLTRFKSEKTSHVPLPIMKEYYTQRASVPGTLLITEATFIASKAGGYPNIPGIWSDEQVKAWKEITDSVHSKKSYIYLQLWALGRAADPAHLKYENSSFDFVSASNIKISERPTDEPNPRPLTVPEIHEYTSLYAQAASNAVLAAGFDGVEVHAANGYLIDQFLQDVSNQRKDEYGGSVENRCRFALEVVKKVTESIGVERTGIRLGPWTGFQGALFPNDTDHLTTYGSISTDMGMEDPKPTFGHLVCQLKEDYPKLSYIHVVEPRIKGDKSVEYCAEGASNDFLRDIWAPRPYISAGGYSRETALEQAEKSARERKGPELIALGDTS